nr:hypothetical protein [Gemmatimonadota bacterium]
MKTKTRQGTSSEEPMLQELIDAARADEPTDAQWEGARARLKTRLTVREWAKGRPGLEPAPRPLWRRVRIRPAAISFSALVLICAIVLPLILSTTSPTPGFAYGVTAGELRIVGADGETAVNCTLRHTSVEASITGFVSRTIVRQTFDNPLSEKIEAVYVFPLPADSAVDSMVILIGDRRIVGAVKPREEARRTYEAARAAGKVAGLLDQERPNIFTQSVANIAPDARVEIEISYVETLKLEDGSFEYSFPMTVAPRYIPGAPITAESDADTTSGTVQVPDASRITPPVAVPGSRTGHDVNIQVFLEAGSEIFEVTSPLHEIEVERDSAERAIVSLKNRREIPNKDFILRY